MTPILLIIIAATCIISYFGFQNRAMFEQYKFNVGAIANRKEYIRLLSSGFLHADFMHLFFNMYVLYMFGPMIISVFGVVGFMLIYIGSIFLGNLFCLFIYKKQSYYSAIGASGGVSGLIFAAVSLDPVNIKLGILFLPPQLSLPGYIFGALYFGYSVYMMLNPKQWDNLGHAAHLGGALFGLVFAIIIYPSAAIHNAPYIGIMALPLIYLAYEVLVKKKIG